MSKMKDLLIWVLEKYDAGYTMSEISRDSLGLLTVEQVRPPRVSRVLSRGRWA